MVYNTVYAVLKYVGAISFATSFFFFVIVPLLSNRMQYKIKVIVYYVLLMLYGFIVAFLALPTAGKLSNYKYPMSMLSLTRWLFGVRFRVNRPSLLKELHGSYILVSNHQSSIDLMGVGLLWPYECTIVAKKSLLFAGWFGFAAWLCGCVFVSRGRQSAQAQMRQLAARVASEGAAGGALRVWIFPEGTRVVGDDLGEFKKGAFHLAVQAQVPVVPIVFSNYSSFYSKRAGRFQPGLVEVSVLDPVPTAGMAESEVTELTGRVRDAMRAEFRRLGGHGDKAE